MWGDFSALRQQRAFAGLMCHHAQGVVAQLDVQPNPQIRMKHCVVGSLPVGVRAFCVAQEPERHVKAWQSKLTGQSHVAQKKMEQCSWAGPLSCIAVVVFVVWQRIWNVGGPVVVWLAYQPCVVLLVLDVACGLPCRLALPRFVG